MPGPASKRPVPLQAYPVRGVCLGCLSADDPGQVQRELVAMSFEKPVRRQCVFFLGVIPKVAIGVDSRKSNRDLERLRD
jgi:hypothetical protein